MLMYDEGAMVVGGGAANERQTGLICLIWAGSQRSDVINMKLSVSVFRAQQRLFETQVGVQLLCLPDAWSTNRIVKFYL